MPQKPDLGRTLLVALLVAVGITSAWGAFSLWSIALLQTSLSGRDFYEQLYTSVDGEPVIVRTSRSGRQNEQVLSLARKPLRFTSQDLLYPQYVLGSNRRGQFVTTPNWHARLAAANDGGLPATYWYLIHDGHTPGTAYGVGYHAQTRNIIGYFGRKGFGSAPPPPNEWFEIPGNYAVAGVSTMMQQGAEPLHTPRTARVLLLADGKLWKIDLAKQELSPLLDCPTAFRIGSVWRIVAKPPNPPEGADTQPAQSITPNHGLVREADCLLVVNPQTGEHKRYPLPESLREMLLAAAVLPDGRLLIMGRPSWGDENHQVFWLKPTGEIEREQKVQVAGYSSPPSPRGVSWQLAVSAPLTLASGIYAAAGPFGLLAQGEAANYSQAFRMLLAAAWPSILAVLIAALISAIAAYRRQKRFGLPHPGAWAAFVFLFGIPGWLAYRFHRAWPILEECPACHHATPHDRDHCLECGALKPPPPLKGIEVFA